jgi:hypothetical protein
MEREAAENSPSRARPFRAFLSHRYRSPEINRYFFNLFADEATIQFTVDRGAYHTNVTRLERFMRDADAFVGIFPVPQDKGQLSGSELRNESRYFRLELDLAERARKPAINEGSVVNELVQRLPS